MEVYHHPLYKKEPYTPGESPEANVVNIPTQPHLPRKQQTAPISMRNGSIWMRSRNIPAQGIRGGMMLLLDLQRAAGVLADDTYEIATQEQIDAEFSAMLERRKALDERERANRTSQFNVTAEVSQPQNLQMAAPEWLKDILIGIQQSNSQSQLPAGTTAAQYIPPAGYKLVAIDEEAPKAHAQKPGRKKSTEVEIDSPIADSISE